jgi:ABC-2 type transport system ATP-binding protein
MIFKGRKVLDGTLADIQDQYGSDTLRVRCENSNGALHSLPGVERVSDFGKVQELRLRDGQDPHEVVQRLVATTRVQSFEVTTPSLHDIFVRIAGPEAQEVHHA